jgi:NADPH:quinone reductase-like Zn-dependent oxidoreductase
MVEALKMRLWPAFLGGGKRKYLAFFPDSKYEDLELVGNWMKEGKVKPIIDQKFSFEQAPKAFEKLKSGRAKGKIVIDVASETYREAWSK